MNLYEKANNFTMITGSGVAKISIVNRLIRDQRTYFFCKRKRSDIPLLSTVDSTNSKVERIMESDIKSVDEVCLRIINIRTYL